MVKHKYNSHTDAEMADSRQKTIFEILVLEANVRTYALKTYQAYMD